MQSTDMVLAFQVTMLEPATAAIACYAMSKVDRRLLKRPHKICLWCTRHHDDLLRSLLDEVSEPILALPHGISGIILCSLFIAIIFLC